VELPDFDWAACAAQVPRYAPSVLLDPAHTALVVVDMQHSSAARASTTGHFLQAHFPNLYSYYFDRLDSLVVPAITRLLAHFRLHNRRIVFLRVGSHLPDGTDFEPNRRERERQMEGSYRLRPVLAYLGDFNSRILDEFQPTGSDLVLTKVSRGAFNSTGIDQLLRNMSINSLVVTGVATDACVAATALDAADRGYRTVLVEDATATIAPILHSATLLIFGHLYGRVLTTDQVVSELDPSSEGR
jgi:nicotinamidase-related amidase